MKKNQGPYNGDFFPQIANENKEQDDFNNYLKVKADLIRAITDLIKEL